LGWLRVVAVLLVYHTAPDVKPNFPLTAMARGKKYEKKIFIPCATVAPNKITLYSRPLLGFNKSPGSNTYLQNFIENDHEGLISIRARKKIEHALTWLLFTSQPKKITDMQSKKSFTFKLNFVTLTLPAVQVHSDQEIKDVCLNNFLTVARKSGLKNYIWRAEAQPSTGNIHFHITTDFYMHYNNIRKWWNQSVALLGYLDAFELKFHHRNPNSTDVHSVKHIRKLSAYLSKYLGKNRAFPCIGELRLIKGEVKEVLYSSQQYKDEEPNKRKGKIIGHMLGAEIRPINGRLWGCSSSLSRVKNVKFDGEEYRLDSILEFTRQHNFKKFSAQWCDNYYGDVAGYSEIWFPQLFRSLKQAFEKGSAKVKSKSI
jgi:hypothetical protein